MIATELLEKIRALEYDDMCAMKACGVMAQGEAYEPPQLYIECWDEDGKFLGYTKDIKVVPTDLGIVIAPTIHRF